MHSSEWSLVFFTLLGQFSAGLLLTTLLLQYGTQSRSDIHNKALYTATGAMVVALLISFLHLSSPLASVYALSNLKSSWLSREILMVSLFAGLLLLSSFLQMRSPQMHRLQSALQWTAAIAGLMMIWSMGRIYMLPTVPAWNTPATMLAFYGSAALTGPAFMALLLHTYTHKTNPLAAKQNMLLLLMVLATGLLLKISATVFFSPPTAWQETAFIPETMPLFWTVLQWTGLLAGAALTTLLLIKNPTEPQPSRLLPFAGFLLIVAAEIIGRAGFYMTFFRTGI